MHDKTHRLIHVHVCNNVKFSLNQKLTRAARIADIRERTGPPGCLELARWSGCFARPGRWTSTSNDEVVGQTNYPVNRSRVGRERREGSEAQSYIEEKGRREWNRGRAKEWVEESSRIFMRRILSFQLRHCWWSRCTYLARAGSNAMYSSLCSYLLLVVRKFG